jgi:hypothetical protein
MLDAITCASSAEFVVCPDFQKTAPGEWEDSLSTITIREKFSHNSCEALANA